MRWRPRPRPPNTGRRPDDGCWSVRRWSSARGWNDASRSPHLGASKCRRRRQLKLHRHPGGLPLPCCWHADSCHCESALRPKQSPPAHREIASPPSEARNDRFQGVNTGRGNYRHPRSRPEFMPSLSKQRLNPTAVGQLLAVALPAQAGFAIAAVIFAQHPRKGASRRSRSASTGFTCTLRTGDFAQRTKSCILEQSTPRRQPCTPLPASCANGSRP